ncbi:MAG: flavin reductase [Sulfuriferula multivorans]|uniref:Flavin reductase n=1 Tax=Sulfuriferula multivorans TaxID=1559896 RepID=A0A7C9P6W5_9PROT|nr:flavin reductase [Sulfuriferula multivorans]
MSVQNPVKRLFMTLTQGVYVVGVAEAGLRDAFTASSVMQVSLQPPMLALAVNPDNASYPLLISSGIFAVTVLQDDQHDLADLFGNHSARDEDKLRRVQWHAATSGAPVLDAGVSYFDCRIVTKQPAGDHVVVMAEVTGGDFLHASARPLQYSELGDMDGSDELLPRHLDDGWPKRTDEIGVETSTSHTKDFGEKG